MCYQTEQSHIGLQKFILDTSQIYLSAPKHPKQNLKIKIGKIIVNNWLLAVSYKPKNKFGKYLSLQYAMTYIPEGDKFE